MGFMDFSDTIPFTTSFTCTTTAFTKFTEKHTVGSVTPVSYERVSDNITCVVCWACHPGGVFDHDEFLEKQKFKGVVRLNETLEFKSKLAEHFKRCHAVDVTPQGPGKHLVFFANDQATAWREAGQKVVERMLTDIGIDERKLEQRVQELKSTQVLPLKRRCVRESETPCSKRIVDDQEL